MSRISHVVLHLGSNIYDKSLMASIFPPDPARGERHFLNSPPIAGTPDKYGGTKHWCEHMLFACFNHLSVSELVSHLRALNWKHPEEWTLMVECEDWNSCSLFWQDGERWAEIIH